MEKQVTTISAREFATAELAREPRRDWVLNALYTVGFIKSVYDDDGDEYVYQIDEDTEDAQIPVVKNLNQKTLEAIRLKPELFFMGAWHENVDATDEEGKMLPEFEYDDWRDAMDEYSRRVGKDDAAVEPDPLKCATTHCRAGWAVALAGLRAFRLERHAYDSEDLGLLIYAVSCPWMESEPQFHEENGQALESIKADAEREAAIAAK